MAKFNPTKMKAFQDFLELQNDLKAAQTSYENAKNMEVVTDTVFGMGLVVGAKAQKMYIRSRNRKLALVGMLLAGGAYLYKNNKKEVSSSRTGRGYVDYDRLSKKKSNRGHIDYSKPRAKQSSRKSEEVKSYEK
jgi:hypothetical protein